MSTSAADPMERIQARDGSDEELHAGGDENKPPDQERGPLTWQTLLIVILLLLVGGLTVWQFHLLPGLTGQSSSYAKVCATPDLTREPAIFCEQHRPGEIWRYVPPSAKLPKVGGQIVSSTSRPSHSACVQEVNDDDTGQAGPVADQDGCRPSPPIN